VESALNKITAAANGSAPAITLTAFQTPDVNAVTYAQCTPSDQTGYVGTPNLAGCTSETCSVSNSSNLTCAPTHAPTNAGSGPSIAKCTLSQTQVTYSGCVPKCRAPASTKGYNIPNPDAFINACTTTSCALNAAANANIQCAAGYTGTVKIGKTCTSTEDEYVTLSGCSQECILPAERPVGYKFTTSELKKCTMDRCDGAVEHGVQCANGYSGTVTIGKCTNTLNPEVTLGGCTIVTTSTTTTSTSTTSTSTTPSPASGPSEGNADPAKKSTATFTAMMATLLAVVGFLMM